MNIDTKEITNFLATIARFPFLAALLVPVVLIYAATKFVAAPVENIIFFGIISAGVLIYSAWVVSVFKSANHDSSKDNM